MRYVYAIDILNLDLGAVMLTTGNVGISSLFLPKDTKIILTKKMGTTGFKFDYIEPTGKMGVMGDIDVALDPDNKPRLRYAYRNEHKYDFSER